MSHRHVASVPPEIRALNRSFATLRYDADGKIIGANPSFVRLLGYELTELLGQEGSLFLPPQAESQGRGALSASLRSGEDVEETALWIAKSGKELWLRNRYVALVDEEARIEEIVQIVDDVTIEHASRLDERGQIAAINSFQAVVHFTLDGFVIDANPHFLDAMGYTLEEIVGRHHSMFVETDYRASEEYRAFWRSLAAGDHKSGEYRRVHKDGREVWLQAVYSPIVDTIGRPMKIVKYASDVTAQKRRNIDYEWQINAIEKSNCVITFDMFGSIIDANENFLKATGYGLEEIVGRHHKMFVDSSEAQSSQYSMFWQDLRNGRHRSGLYKRVDKDRREIWLQATYNPIFDTVGKPIKVVKYASVVTQERLVQAEHQGQIAAIHNAQCVISFELDGTIIDANENFLKTMGYRFAEVRGRHHSMFVESGHAGSEEYRSFWKDLGRGVYHAGEYKRIGKDGREIWLQANYNPILDLNGRPFKIVKYATDVTVEKLRQADHVSQIEAINKAQGVAVFTLDGTIVDVNENFLAMMGYSAEELKGRHHSLMVEKHVASGSEYASFWSKLASGEYHAGMYKRIGKDGREIWIQASYNPILDLNGKPCRVIKYATDVSSNVALAQAFDDAKRQAHHDSATSLPNRVKLSTFMGTHLAGAGATMAVFYIDLDRFKPINDTFGHHVGDSVLGEVADRLRRVLREDQMVARVGGDEFVIAAPGLTSSSVERFCKKLYEIVTQPIRYEGSDISVGMSVGVAMAPSDGATPDDLLRAADAALYRSKQNGRGQFSFFATEMNERILADRKLTEDMRHSLEQGNFYLEYQPRFDTRARSIRSMEALVRWAHPERGRISPADFISIAERNGLIVSLGDWILNTACREAANWSGIGVSVNVSPVQFREGNLAQRVKECLASTGLPPHLLELEVTEGVLLEDSERAFDVLSELKDIGVKLAMDDFGTGYSSLNYLRNFPFDVIKIDRSFINDLGKGKSARSIVQAILGLGKALGLSVTAEGVETNEQLTLLTADQCNEVQGFLMARPLRADQVAQLLSELDHLHPEPADPVSDARAEASTSVRNLSSVGVQSPRISAA